MADGAEKPEGRSAGPWFDLPEPAYARRAAQLSNKPDITSAAADYREKGYLVRDFGFSESDLAAAAAFTKAIPIGRVQDGWLINKAVRNLATHPRVIEFLNELYQAEAFPFQTLNFPRGSQQETHADTFHFNTLPHGFMCGVWIALEDIQPGSGALKYYPGSQKLPVFSTADLNGADVQRGYNRFIADEIHKFARGSEIALIKRGQAFIWAANLFHGGDEITDPNKTRLSQVTHYYFRGCSYFTPLASDAEGGKTFWREPYDFLSNRFVKNADPTHRPSWRYRLAERRRIWFKQFSEG